MFNKRHANPRQKFELLKGKPAFIGDCVGCAFHPSVIG